MTDPQTIVLIGATGTIGRATLRQLSEAGYTVRALARDASKVSGEAEVIEGDVTDPATLATVMAGADGVVSCLASRTGVPRDAYAIDRDAHLAALAAAEAAGVSKFVLLSAICVQKPRLAFQHAKLEFEAALQASTLSWSIVRPTAYFKSIVGQVARVKAGKAYLMFGDGTGTSATPISDRDLGRYLTQCLSDPSLQNKVLPIGGPHPALTPRDIGLHIFEKLEQPPKLKSIPPGFLVWISRLLRVAGTVVPSLKDKAELARIGHYYATESMLVWNGSAYDAAATPAYGTDQFLDYLDAVIQGREEAERGDHAVF